MAAPQGIIPAAVVAHEVDHGLREVDQETGSLVALEYWKASQTLPADLLAMLPPPAVGGHGVERAGKIRVRRPSQQGRCQPRFVQSD
jgi:hypothetical protein